MKYRNDITEYLKERMEYFKKDYKIYEQNDLLYRAEYFYDSKNKIECYTDYHLVGVSDDLKKEIEKEFNVLFAHKSMVVCRCGKMKSFSAKYGAYVLILICNECGNEFTAYSG